MATYSATHWWSCWEVIEQVSILFGDILPFLRREDLGSATTAAKLLTYFTNPEKKALLEVELATIIDWGKPFVTATYSLEGDGPLALECYERIETIKAAIHTAHTPNLDTVAHWLSASTEKGLLQRVFSPLRSRGSTFSSQTFQQRILQYGTAWIILKSNLILVKKYFQPSKLLGSFHHTK